MVSSMDVKSYFHSWCSRIGRTPLFDIATTGSKARQRFLCEVRVEGFPYTGRGSSTSEKVAELNAARDFMQFLVRRNYLLASEVPNDTFSTRGGRTGAPEVPPIPCYEPVLGSRPMIQSSMYPGPRGEAYRPYREGGVENGVLEFEDRVIDEKGLAEAEDEDVNASMHGNWTIKHGKSRLHQFLQQHNIKWEYKYTIMGVEGSRNFEAELTIFVDKLNRTFTGRESGSNKSIASKSCALSLVRQLYHHGIIEAFTGSLKKNRDKKNKMQPYPVLVSQDLEKKIYQVLREINIEPVRVRRTKDFQKGKAVSILNSTVLEDFTSSQPQPASILSWAPPGINWNLRSTEDGLLNTLSTSTLDKISRDMEAQHRDQLQNNEKLQRNLQDRETLPIAGCKKEIMNMIRENPVSLIRGSTGCGKTTQICQFILDEYIEMGKGAYCNIVMTQPKRISAVSVADRIAYERCEPLGISVGYSVRFETLPPRPYGSILLCTVGTLLKKLDKGLRGVSHVVVDEVHERDVNTDFILVILRDMVRAYPDMRIILMSAAVDATLFSEYFGGCPVFEIADLMYPVHEYFLEDCIQFLNFTPSVESKKRKPKKEDEHEEDVPQTGDDFEENMNLVIDDEYLPETKQAMALMNEEDINFELISGILHYIRDLKIDGAVLIFLPGWNYIFSLMKYLQQQPLFNRSQYAILPLHSCLPLEEQKRVFETFPAHMTKVILASNIAESSITINDVVFVIDSCKIRLKMFTAHNNLTHYATVWASKTNLQQRRGRAGRVRPGICFHLCSKARYRKLSEHMTPEMFRTPLHQLALAIKMLRLGAVSQFLSKAVEPPPMDSVMEAEVFLREMKCLDENDELTPLGRIIGHLPVDPRIGKMLILGSLFNCINPLSIIAASSSTFSDIFLNPVDGRGLTYQQRAFAGNRFSDHIALLNAFQGWEHARKTGNESAFCDAKMLSGENLKITWEARNQLLTLLSNAYGFPEETTAQHMFSYNASDENLDMVTAILCVGLYPNIAYHMSKRKFLTTGNKIAFVNKRSVNCSNKERNFPFPFFVYGEKIRTMMVACKQMTMITPIHLLLFGSQKVEYVNGIVRLDGWINLDMNPRVAAAIVALRPVLEGLVIKAAKDPSQIVQPNPTDAKVMNLIRELCRINTCGKRFPSAAVHVPASPSYLPRRDNNFRANESENGKRMNEEYARYPPHPEYRRSGYGGGYDQWNAFNSGARRPQDFAGFSRKPRSQPWLINPKHCPL